MGTDGRHLDELIDGVARALTAGEPPGGDLRRAVASGIARPPSWAAGWRTAALVVAAAALVIMAVVMSLRPQEPPPRAAAHATPSTGARPVMSPPRAMASSEGLARADHPPRLLRAAGGYQTSGAAVTGGIVHVDPLAIVPLADDEALDAMAPPAQVNVVPIDVEPVRIRQLEALE